MPNRFLRNIQFAVAALAFLLLVVVLYPLYQNYIDPDATAYLTIAKRYAEGDYSAAINGYWSPLGCWLTAAFMKLGLQAIPAAVAANTAGGMLFLYGSNLLFTKFNISSVLKWWYNCALAVFLVFAVYYQLFDDLWMAGFLLVIVRVLQYEDFATNIKQWFLVGALGAFAYFSKAYALPFLVIYLFIALAIKSRFCWVQVFKAWSFILLVLLTIAAVWINALSAKYGAFTTSTAGGLNLYWYNIGHPLYKSGIQSLLPPPYHNSPYFWEDPFTVNQQVSFWSVPGAWLIVLKRLPINLLKFVVAVSLLHIPMAVVYLQTLALAVKKQFQHPLFTKYSDLVLLLFLFPSFYFLINFESRYIWVLLPVSLVLSSLIVPTMKHWMIAFSVACLVLYPIKKLMSMAHVGRNEFNCAGAIKSKGLKGKFITTAAEGAEIQGMERLAYFSGLQLYSNGGASFDTAKTSTEITQYNIDFLATCHPADTTKTFCGKQLVMLLNDGNYFLYRLK